jgi:hypothetical protein
MMRLGLAVACVLVSGLAVVPLWAKGPTTRIAIAAPNLQAPLEMTDPALLRRFAVWAGPGTTVNDVESSEGFIIDWRSGAFAEPGPDLPRYEVSFYAKYANRPEASQDEHLAYVVRYAPNPAGRRGYVYLPGRGDVAFALNARTIFRGVEGRWFRASDAWYQVAATLLARVDRSANR